MKNKNVEKEVIKQYIVDGVPYEIDEEENIMDPEDCTAPIGKPDGHGGILFDDEDSEEKHKENIEKYSIHLNLVGYWFSIEMYSSSTHI